MRYKLGEVADLIGGGTPKTTVAEYWNVGIHFCDKRESDFGNILKPKPPPPTAHTDTPANIRPSPAEKPVPPQSQF
ncbi:MAG: hypothetical protein LBK75_03185 [Oscillospiraceae bacterium]|nr:hypothetical protein [Oscillospiraceae bacterium]